MKVQLQYMIRNQIMQNVLKTEKTGSPSVIAPKTLKPNDPLHTGIELQHFAERATQASSYDQNTLLIKDTHYKHMQHLLKKKDDMIKTLIMTLIGSVVLCALSFGWALYLKDSILFHQYTEHHDTMEGQD